MRRGTTIRMLGGPEMHVCTSNENFEFNKFEEVSAFSKPFGANDLLKYIGH
jgi:hypothetical protein